MAGLLDPSQGDGSYVENRPSKWAQTWGILGPYVTEPFNAMERLWNSPAIQYGFEPSEQDVADSFNIAGSVVGAGSVVPKPDDALNMGIKAFHGSPYDFDRFSMDKIGTGVGAPDAFSKGLYFAEAEKNAEHFKALGATPMIGGKKYRSAGLSPDANEAVWKFVYDQGKSGTLADVAAEAAADLAARGKELPFSARRDYQRVIDELKSRGQEDVHLGAHMYEVDINANPASFAEWDTPISQQSEMVKNALSEFPQEKTWREVYESGRIRPSDMLKQGVSGTTYRANDGSRNYVVFDDNLINIIRKYGIAGLLGGSATMDAMMSEPQEQY